MKYMFFCGEGFARSPTAARVALIIAQEERLDVEVSYQGINDTILECRKLDDDTTMEARKLDNGAARERRKSDSENVRNAFAQRLRPFDRIVVMEPYMQRFLIECGVDERRIRCLSIPDEYSRDDPPLVEILHKALTPLMISWEEPPSAPLRSAWARLMGLIGFRKDVERQ